MGGEHCHGGVLISGDRGTGVETEPADPQQTGPNHHQPGGVWRVDLVRKPGPRAQHDGDHKGGDACSHMHHDAAGKIYHAQFCQPAAAPYPVGHWGIDQQQPQSADQHNRTKLDALDKCADHQCRRDDRKGHLEHRKQRFGQCAAHGLTVYSGHGKAIKQAEIGCSLAEGD